MGKLHLPLRLRREQGLQNEQRELSHSLHYLEGHANSSVLAFWKPKLEGRIEKLTKELEKRGAYVER